MILDPWQKELLETEGNIVAACGRQVGKSTIVSIKAAEFAVNERNQIILIIASVERQAQLLFEKTLNYLYEKYPKMIKKGKDRPTKHIINLMNGSRIHCLPTGLSGYGIRGYTINLLIADEAAFIPEDVWAAVTPMLAVTGGKIIMLSTPHGRGGFFCNSFKDPNFKSFHISSEDCPRKDQRFLDEEKKRMTKLHYAQEYLGEFVDELRQFFPTDLIVSAMKLSRGFSGLSPTSFPRDNNFLGVDVARMGSDETVLFSVHRTGDLIRQLDLEITEKTLLTETILRIKNSDKKFNFKKIYIDTTGLGSGVFDPLLADSQTKRKVVSIENASRSLDSDDKTKKKILKEDLYNNLLRLFESHQIELFDEPEILLSLKSVQYEYSENSIKIFGNYTHIAEALVRAAWCVQDKTLNIWIA